MRQNWFKRERSINVTFRDSLVAKKDMRPRSDSEVATSFSRKDFDFLIPGAAAKHQEGDPEHAKRRI